MLSSSMSLDVTATRGQAAKWPRGEHAFHLADVRLGTAEGPAFVSRVMALMGVVLRERQVVIGCTPVGRRHISEDEQAMMTAVRNAFQGNLDTFSA